MIVGVGSKNKTKVDAVALTLRDYPMFANAEVEGVAVQVEEHGHPKSIGEVTAGAVARAKQAYAGHDYGFGIEGGLMEVPLSKSGYLEITACAIFDGAQVHIGLSSAFEWPKSVIEGILHKGLEGSTAMREAGLTDEHKIGENGGTIALLTKGRMDRTMQNMEAVRMALIHLENPEHF